MPNQNYDHTDPMPPRPEGWKHDWSTCTNVTDWDGTVLATPANKRRDYAKLWEKHKALLAAEVELRSRYTPSPTGFNSRAYNSYEENKMWEDSK